GGVLDTQVVGKTGVFFTRQSPESLQKALLEFDTIEWNYHRIREHVLSNFTEDVFFERVTKVIEAFYQKRSGSSEVPFRELASLKDISARNTREHNTQQYNTQQVSSKDVEIA
ncbi:MAG: hypothetical protein AAF329_22005, partial [Cyanobacteria bacterium P01_A01_bin.17]